MKKRGRQAAAKKPSAADFLASPPDAPPKTSDHNDNSDGESPKSFHLKLHSPATSPTSASLSRRKQANAPPLSRPEAVASVAELKEMVSTRIESIKKQVERSHSDIVKEIDSSNSRLHTRFKMQTQACQQLIDATDKEFKKMSERISESCEAMKVSYAEFIVEAQTSFSRVCKTSIPEKAESFEKAIEGFRSRYVM